MERQIDLIRARRWEVLIILDACRYDVFYEMYGRRFRVKPCWSEGSCTLEWFTKTFRQPMLDVVYVSGNPLVSNSARDFAGTRVRAGALFYRLVDAWRPGWQKIGYAYTVSPQVVASMARVTAKMYPDKRLIVHFLQPHAPYPFSEELAPFFRPHETGPDVYLWDALKRGMVKPDVVAHWYRENLKWVMGVVEKLIVDLRPRRVVITADHAEAWGENGIYNHPCGSEARVLRVVPWAEAP